MKKIFFILLITFFTFQLFTSESIIKLQTSLPKTTGLEKAEILYVLASRSDSLNLSERINFCLQAEEIAINTENNELLLDILLLESNLYKETPDLENYSLSIEKYFKLNEKITKFKIENSKKQISKNVRNRNLLIIGFIVFLNITFIFILRMRLKAAEHIRLEKTNKQLEELSRKDSLTSIPNRRDILDKIFYETIRVERNKKTFSLIMCDIDHFKSVNDKHGHECGDYILKKIADTIVSNLRKQDIVARWGGEEFILLLPETNLEGGRIAAEKIRIIISNYEFKYNNKIILINLTFGVSEYSIDKSIDSCIKEADKALYHGKNNGRNRVEVFNPKDILVG